MSSKPKPLSEYRAMWLFAMFDLPVETREQRRDYSRFRKALLNEGFSMLQYSVYARYCSCEDLAREYRARVAAYLPPSGQVRLLHVTDNQFGKMENYIGKNRAEAEQRPVQLMLF